MSDPLPLDPAAAANLQAILTAPTYVLAEKDLDFLATHARDAALAEKIRRANLLRGEIQRAEKKHREKEMR